MTSEWTLNTKLPVSFTIKKSYDLFNIENKDILNIGNRSKKERRLIVIDSNVNKLYYEKIKNYFEYYKIQYKIIIINSIEENKNLETLTYLLDEIENFNLMRKAEPIIAIGGGVLLDIVGLAANLYRRGVPYIKIPTTLIGLIDVSVGVKTAINFKNRRNRLGTYYPPLIVFLDKTFLNTLDSLEISSGLGEILKMAIVKDKELFDILKEHGKELYDSFVSCKYADDVIDRAIESMKTELEDNLWELNLQRYVDFGHSFSPIIEMRSLTDNNAMSLTHGQAVTLDVLYSCLISYNRKMLSKKDVLCVFKTIKDMGLLTFHPYFLNENIIWEALNDVTKHRNGNQNLPIPKTIGSSLFINDFTYDEAQVICRLFKRLNLKKKL